MRRREALVALAAVSTAGCLGDVRSAIGLDGEEDPPEPVAPDRPLDQYDCPRFQTLDFDAVGRTICYREADDGPSSVTFTASKREAHLPPDVLEFTMQRSGSGPAFYVVSEGLVTRLTDEGWQLVAPTNGASADEANPVPLRSGESQTWRVGIGGESPDENASGDLLRLGNVGPGVYAFRARGRVGTVTEARDIDIAHAMLFTVRNQNSS